MKGQRSSPDDFKTQKRVGIGNAGTTPECVDWVELLTVSRTKTDLHFFSNIGKVYKVRGYRIPEGSRTSKGLPIINFLPLADGERILAILSMDDYAEGSYLFFVTEKGIVKKTASSEYQSINKAGKIALGLRPDDRLFAVKPTDGHAKIAIASQAGKLCLFDETGVRAMGRTAAGVRGMNLAGSIVVGFATSLEGNLILTVSQNGFSKMSPLDEYRETSRGSKGVLTLKVNDKTGALVSMNAVEGDEDVLVVTDGGTIMKTSLTQIKEQSRNSIGVILIRPREGEKIASVSIEPSDAQLDKQTAVESAKAKENQEREDAKEQAEAVAEVSAGKDPDGDDGDDGDDSN